MSESASPVDRILDLALYAPVGLALTVLDDMPKWVEVGRRQVGARLSSARVIGRLAVDQGSRRSGEVMRRVAEQADNVMAGLGLTPDPATERSPGSVPERNPGSVPDQLDPDPMAPLPSSPSPGSAPVNLDPAQLAIPGYDTLSASQVVQRLPGLSPEELEAVRLYELAGRARKTVLLKAAQLHAGP